VTAAGTNDAAASEVADEADFSDIRYAQCWEDADVLLAGLDVREGDVCLSVASAGDNTLSLLTRNPAKVVALDLSPAQIACLELRVAAYRHLEHPELLELVGATESEQRPALYARLRPHLPGSTRGFWDARPASVAMGIGACGKFEAYFRTFRTRVLSLVHTTERREALFVPRSLPERRNFYARVWDNRRWRLLFRLFFSRFVMGRLGRDPRFFRYVEGDVATRILERTRHALCELDPVQNPYAQWIVLGRFGEALPHALRPENFDAIRAGIEQHRLTWQVAPIESYLEAAGPASVDRFNLSDIFEYMSAEGAEALLGKIARAGRAGGRLAYWNMLVPRSRPPSLAHRLRPLPDLAASLHRQDKAFFYSAFVLEEIA
jgi:S-adenosylmethionine-diacylglycerol 3-amino-3-carboxypropyl transferase